MYSARQKLEAVEREIVQRKKLFPRRVEQGHMTKAEAEYQIEIMKDIARDYGRELRGGWTRESRAWLTIK